MKLLSFTPKLVRRYAKALAAAAPPEVAPQLLAAASFGTTTSKTRLSGPSKVATGTGVAGTTGVVGTGAAAGGTGPATTAQSVDVPPGSPLLRHISAGSDGTVWGVDAQGTPQSWNPQTRTWTPLKTGLDPGGVVRIAVGSRSVVWAVADDQTIWFLDSANGVWKKDPDSHARLKDIACAQDGMAWGVNSDSDVFFRRPGESQYNRFEGEARAVAVSSAAKAYHIGDNDNLYWFYGSPELKGDWNGKAPIGPVTAIAASADSLWGTSGSAVFKWDASAKKFVQQFQGLKGAENLSTVAPVSAPRGVGHRRRRLSRTRFRPTGGQRCRRQPRRGELRC